MATIRPFAAIHYAKPKPGEEDVSRLIAPPYDVLDARQYAERAASHPNNIVGLDLPHFPPDSAGPDEAYDLAGMRLQTWMNEGVLVQDRRPGFYPYAQMFESGGRQFRRRGVVALVRLSPFGAGDIVPHEKTHAGPIEDRLKLMRATGVQLSPIFGLFSDPRNEITNLLYRSAGRPMLSGSLGPVRSDLWYVSDAEIESQVIDLMGGRPIYIADGHHRYTTALQYQFEMEQKHGGPLPEAHSANWCMFVLVGMQDPGLLILPTHRLVGGMKDFDIAALRSAAGQAFDIAEAKADQVPAFIRDVLPKQPPHTFGLFDGKTRKLYQIRLKDADILRDLEPTRSDAWRRLDVAILQRFLIDEVIRPTFCDGQAPAISYSADPDAISTLCDGQGRRIALLLQPTPLMALEELARHGEVMPQKSTYFYPKLATGMVINPLR